MPRATDAPAPRPDDPLRRLVVAYRVVLVLLTAGLAKGAHGLVTGEVHALLPRLEGWMRALPVVAWIGLATAIFGLWRWRWWGYRLALGVATFDLAVELYGGGIAWHVLRIPVAVVLLVGLCIPLRLRFRGSGP